MHQHQSGLGVFPGQIVISVDGGDVLLVPELLSETALPLPDIFPDGVLTLLPP